MWTNQRGNITMETNDEYRKAESFEQTYSKLTNAKYKINRGRAARRRDRAISDKLHEVHKSYDSRPAENTVQHDGTILFDLT